MTGSRKVPCPRCGGRGGRMQRHGSGTCFRCKGAGSIAGAIRPGRDLVLFFVVLAAMAAVVVWGRLP